MRTLYHMSETDLKSQVRDYLALRGIFNYHLLQGIGAYRGAPDRVAHVNGRVVYLEIKLPKGKQSENQVNFEAQCRADKIDYWVIRSVEELMAKIEEAVYQPPQRRVNPKSITKPSNGFKFSPWPGRGHKKQAKIHSILSHLCEEVLR